MIRKIIQISEAKCNGCGACAAACHEGAIAMINGKARLLRDDYCDGLGDCLPACPTNAITFTMREAAAYDESAVQAAKLQKASPGPSKCPDASERSSPLEHPGASECPGSLEPPNASELPSSIDDPSAPERSGSIDCPDASERPGSIDGPGASELPGRLTNWPVQLRLAPVSAPYFQGADLLIAADCTAYAHGTFHERFLKGRIALIGCPKLDAADYSEKLAALFQANDPNSITIVRMEVPCCRGLELSVKKALESTGKSIPCQTAVLSTDGSIIEIH
ncbi:MAG: 4Fe-4S binding protein [Eubacteriales bacterium]|nr:4Fe-4S binding protein [Eubacteriales bacterium]